jgi:VWFA-related protein
MKLTNAARTFVAFGWMAAAGMAQAPEIVIRSTTRLVQVEVVVRDSAGRPVAGLTKDDFEVYEDKRRQPIQFFAGYRRDTPALAEVPPGMVSNRPEVTGPRRGATVILVDSLNTGWAARARAYENLLTFLKGADPGDRVALYTFGHQLKVFHDFTGDAGSLLKRIEAMGNPTLAAIGDEPGLDEIIPEAADLYQWGQNWQDSVRLVARATATLDTLTGIANHLGSTPGWKSLIWISGGFPLQTGMDRSTSSTQWRGARITTGEFRSFGPEFDRAIKALTNSNVAVYPIDPIGLQTAPEYDAASRGPVSAQPWQETGAMFRQMAKRTGGRAYTDINDILGSLKDVTEGAQSSYTIAYYAPNPSDDGKYRRIDVRLKTRGLTASHREGYYAIAADDLRQTDPEKAMLAAARDPLDSAVVGIDAHLHRAATGPRIQARIHTAELIAPAGSGFVLEATAGVYQFDLEGRLLGAVTDKISIPCNPTQAAQLSQFGMSYDRGIALDPQTVRVRLAVRSIRTGAIGSITLPVPPAQ